jgi:D-sedoheptulose 7-phosphate isomerase
LEGICRTMYCLATRRLIRDGVHYHSEIVALAEKFPSQPYASPADYFRAYRDSIAQAWQSVDASRITAAAELLRECMERDGIIYACGNGGSAAIANHLLCDFHKGIQTGTTLKPRVVSLSAHLELLTAIANDISYDDVFVYQLRTMARLGDLLMIISSSGNSENIVRATTWAKQNNIPTISLTGFSGGRSATIADVAIHVAAENYGIVEDVHQSVMHLLSQHLRQAHMSPEAIKQSNF